MSLFDMYYEAMDVDQQVAFDQEWERLNNGHMHQDLRASNRSSIVAASRRDMHMAMQEFGGSNGENEEHANHFLQLAGMIGADMEDDVVNDDAILEDESDLESVDHILPPRRR